MGTFSNIKDLCAICLKLGDMLFSSLAKLLIEARNAAFVSSSVFCVCYVAHNITCFNNKVCLTKKHLLA